MSVFKYTYSNNLYNFCECAQFLKISLIAWMEEALHFKNDLARLILTESLTQKSIHKCFAATETNFSRHSINNLT